MRIVVLLIFVFAWAMPGFSAVAPVTQKTDAVQTQIDSQIPFNAPSEHPYSTVIAKVHFVFPSFLPEQLLDLPGQAITTGKSSILTNSYRHNVFYVEITTNAP